MDDLEALVPDPDPDPASVMPEMSAPIPRTTAFTPARVAIGVAVVLAMTLAGFVAGSALTGSTPTLQFAGAAAAIAPGAGPAGATGAAPLACAAPLKARGVRGTVATVDHAGNRFTVTHQTTTVTVKVDGATTYQVLASGSAADLTTGTAVALRADKASNAAQILLVPGLTGSAGTPPKPRTATITATSLNGGTGTVTVSTPGGTRTVNVTSTTKIYKIVSGAFSDLAAGQPVTVMSAATPTPSSTVLTAGRVVINKTGGTAPFGPFAALAPTFRGQLRAPGCAAGKMPVKRGGASGTVGNLNGANFSLTNPGGTTNVTTSAATVFTKVVQQPVSEIKPGTLIVVQGTPSSDGTSIAARQIAVPQSAATPPNPPPVAGGHRPGRAFGTVVNNDSATGTLTIKTTDGTTLKVTTTAQLTFSATVPATLADVHDGLLASAQGTPDASGTIAAARVVIGGPGRARLGWPRPFGG